jgi:ATP-dependent Clp protease ATP-binding subunit ClpA
MLTQETLNQYHTEALKVSILLLDEIEKSSDALWSLLLGILDKATLTLGDNRRVDFSQTIVVMTSNLGAREMAKKDIGFGIVDEEQDQTRLEQKAMSAVRSKFSPEFINRLQHTVMFKTLTEEQIEKILDIELEELSLRISAATLDHPRPEGSLGGSFEIAVSPSAKRRLITEGYDKTYGARHLKRAIDKLIQRPLSKMYNSNQILNKDVVVVDDSGNADLDFFIHNRITEESK